METVDQHGQQPQRRQYVNFAFDKVDPEWHRFPSVKLNTTYSFGLDDQEWVVASESDKPEDFVDLVMALRVILLTTNASALTAARRLCYLYLSRLARGSALDG